MVEAEPGEEEGKPVEVLYPPDVEDVIVLVDPVDLIDPPEGIDPDKPDVRGYGPNKPDLPSPEKDHISTEEFLGKEEISLDEAGEPEEQMTDEDEMRSEPHVEILEPPQTADSVEEILPEGATEMSIDRVSVEECDSEEERK